MISKNEISTFCADAVEAGYGEFAMEELAYHMELYRKNLEMECAEMKNSLITIHKLNKNKNKEISALSEIGD